MKFIFTLIFFIVSLTSFAQSDTTKLKGQVEHGWGQWTLDGKKIKASEVKNIFMQDDMANSYYKKSKTNTILAAAFTAPAVIFYTLAANNREQVATNKLNGYLVVGFISSGIVLYEVIRLIHNRKKAIRAYNKNHLTTY
ncbi:MAG TPA: hypothetical protein PKW62_09155 [Chitinophagaceae bacterium]|nr:hypothetical protein [Chitinophagaceae bacterium]